MAKRKKYKRKAGGSALNGLQEVFPKVMEIVDADEPLLTEVTNGDVRRGEQKDHRICPLAVSCKRTTHADGIWIGLSRAYVINGSTATRYRITQGTRGEIVSFDKGARFEVGFYMLSVPNKASGRGGRIPENRTGPKKKAHRQFRHWTTGVRTVLGKYIPPQVFK